MTGNRMSSYGLLGCKLLAVGMPASLPVLLLLGSACNQSKQGDHSKALYARVKVGRL